MAYCHFYHRLDNFDRLEDEFRSSTRWRECNEIMLNLLDMKEIVFLELSPPSVLSRPYSSCMPLKDIESVKSVTLLRVLFGYTSLRFDEHITFVLTCCGQRLHSLNTLRGQGLSHSYTKSVFQPLVIPKFTYELPAWGGFLQQHRVLQIEVFLSKAF
jgi:hypothetical protein